MRRMEDYQDRLNSEILHSLQRYRQRFLTMSEPFRISASGDKTAGTADALSEYGTTATAVHG